MQSAVLTENLENNIKCSALMGFLLYTKRNSAVNSFGITAEFEIHLIYRTKFGRYKLTVNSFGVTPESVSVYNKRTS